MKDFIPVGRKNRPGRPNPCNYITIHETDNTDVGANAKAHAAYLKGAEAESKRVSWHYTVDDKGYYQHLPDDESAFHAGDGGTGVGNGQSIGIEICVNSDGDYEKAKQRAAELVSALMEKHNISIENVVQHNHWNGKNCPYRMRREKGGWTGFLESVGKASKISLVKRIAGEVLRLLCQLASNLFSAHKNKK